MLGFHDHRLIHAHANRSRGCVFIERPFLNIDVQSARSVQPKCKGDVADDRTTGDWRGAEHESVGLHTECVAFKLFLETPNREGGVTERAVGVARVAMAVPQSDIGHNTADVGEKAHRDASFDQAHVKRELRLS